jgi:hypothetical protein
MSRCSVSKQRLSSRCQASAPCSEAGYDIPGFFGASARQLPVALRSHPVAGADELDHLSRGVRRRIVEGQAHLLRNERELRLEAVETTEELVDERGDLLVVVDAPSGALLFLQGSTL